MRVFLDENVDPALESALGEHVVESVRSRGWFGVSNGELIDRIEADFDVFISHDQGLAHQQNWAKRELGLVILLADSTSFESYSEAVGSLQEVLTLLTLVPRGVHYCEMRSL